MAVEPLIDLSKIDLTKIALTPDEIGAMNPQTGDMRQLDYIAYFNEDTTIAVGVKEVKADEFWVAGHIPGRPLYPGVLMIEAAAQISCVLYHKKCEGNFFMGFTRCDNCSFRGQVVPGESLALVTLERKFQRRRFVCDVQGFVGDRFIFEAQVTGMQI